MIAKAEIVGDQGTAADDSSIVTNAVSHVAGGSNDVIVDTSSPPNLNGGTGDDFILGRGASERILGGAGNDLLAGSRGSDVFVFGEQGA